MLGDNKTINRNENTIDVFETGIALMQNGAYADSFLLFLKLAADENQIAARYNLAFCYFLADENQTAFEMLEKAYSSIKKKAPVMKNPHTVQKPFLMLSKSDAAQNEYLKPMPQKLPEILPDTAKRNILRLLIDVCAAAENWDTVMNYSAALQPAEKEYENVKKAILEAQKNKGVL